MFSATVLVGLWLVVAWRLPTVWQEHWKRAPWVALAALAVALTSGLAPVVLVIDRWTVNDFSTLVKHASGVIAAAAVLSWMDALASPGRYRYRSTIRLATTIVIASMIGLFIVMPRRESPDWTIYVTGGTSAAYLLLMYVYLGVALGIASRIFWRASRPSPRGTIRWGLWLLAAGTACSTVYAVFMSAALALRMTHAVSLAEGQQLLAAGAVPQSLAISAILAGLSIPAIGVACRAVWDLWAIWKLRNLWQALVLAVPDVALGAVRGGLAEIVGNPRVRLIRRVCECRDAALALGGYVPPSDVDAARGKLSASGMTGSRLDSAAEACWLKMAMRAAASGRNAEHPVHVFPGSDTLQDEVRWLRQVANAMGSDTVRMIIAELTGETNAH